jgi:alpha-L-arabinofuranosidase
MEKPPRVLSDMKNQPEAAFGAVDALAAVATDGGLVLSLVHRGTAGPVRLSVALDDFAAAGKAEVRTLTAEVPWAANSLKAPEAVKPVDSSLDVRDGRFEMDLKPFSVVRVRIPWAQGK